MSLPLGSIVEKVVYLDSRDADTYFATKLNPDGSTKTLHSYIGFNLEEKIEVPSNMDIEVSLQSATIPYSFYNIRKDINDLINFEIYEIILGVPTNKGAASFVVPEGNYSALSLAAYLSDAMDNKTGVENPTAPTNYTFDYTQNWNNDLGKFEFGIEGVGAYAGSDLQLTFLIDDGNSNTMITELGLDPNAANFQFQGPPEPFEKLSPNFVDVNGMLHGLFIRTNLTSANTMESSSTTFSNILGRIPITSAPGDVIFKEPSNTGHKSLIQTKSFSQIVVKLTDDRNNLLDLNGLHFQIAIQINYVYHQDIAPILTREQARQQAESNVYNVVSDTSAQQKIIEATQQQINSMDLIPKNKGGRPRKVGRPKKKKNN